MKRKFVATVASLALLTACSGGGEETSGAAETEEPATAETTESAEPAGDAGSTVLIATVGTEDDPEAPVISLTTEDGEEVTELPAGDYTIRVSDRAASHNFHLLGGDVEESTTVPGTDDAVFEVALTPGDYTYRCDPHPSMTGSFTVTS